MKEYKTVGIQITTDQQAALEAAAAKFGLGIGPFMRMAALQAAAALGIHSEQPRVD